MTEAENVMMIGPNQNIYWYCQLTLIKYDMYIRLVIGVRVVLLYHYIKLVGCLSVLWKNCECHTAFPEKYIILEENLLF